MHEAPSQSTKGLPGRHRNIILRKVTCRARSHLEKHPRKIFEKRRRSPSAFASLYPIWDTTRAVS
eukprot:6202041-Pleurochrysis_carterae.AAC.1